MITLWIVLTLIGAAAAFVGCIFLVMFVASYIILRKIKDRFK